jgi:hypothetical protein
MEDIDMRGNEELDGVESYRVQFALLLYLHKSVYSFRKDENGKVFVPHGNIVRKALGGAAKNIKEHPERRLTRSALEDVKTFRRLSKLKDIDYIVLDRIRKYL